MRFISMNHRAPMLVLRFDESTVLLLDGAFSWRR